MSLHQSLSKKYGWYKKWHNFKYAQTVHYLVFGVFIVYNFYLAITLQQLTKL